jgi:acetylglutamate kinase
MHPEQKRPELIVVDYRPQEDLMFWDQLSRSFSTAHREGRWICLVVGCAEQVQNVLFQHDVSTKRNDRDEFDFPRKAQDDIEKVVREEKQTIATRLTDEGVAAVGMIGFDRGLIRSREGKIVASDRLQNRLWQAPGVVPVLMSVVQDESGEMKDVNPILLADAMSEKLTPQPHITILSHRISGTPKPLNLSDEQGLDEDYISKGIISSAIQISKKGLEWTISGPSIAQK